VRVPLGAYLSGLELDAYTIKGLVMANYDYGNYTGINTTLTWEN